METRQKIENRLLEIQADKEDLQNIRKSLMGLRATSPMMIVTSIDDTIEHCDQRLTDLKEDLKNLPVLPE